MKNATCLLMDVKGDVHNRKSRNIHFNREELSIMVGGDVELVKLKCDRISVGDMVLKNPVFGVNKRAKDIPLIPNEAAMVVLKKAGLVELPLGNVIFISSRKVEKDLF